MSIIAKKKGLHDKRNAVSQQIYGQRTITYIPFDFYRCYITTMFTKARGIDIKKKKEKKKGSDMHINKINQ